MALPPKFEARLLAARALTPLVRELTFERVDGAPMAFEPGQWVSTAVPTSLTEGLEAKRSYSLASAPDGSPRFEIAVTQVQGGLGSTWLHAIKPDATVPFVGPHGFFTRSAAAGPPSLMVATGTGVTPLRSMIRAAIAAGSGAPMWLVFGARREEDILYDAEFHAAARAHPFFRFETSLSQPQGSWSGRRGYVQTHVRSLWEELNRHCDQAPHAYVCGLQRMVGSVRDLLRKEMAIGREQVHTERYD
jgi:CDP-4-dehydro-6-deoxyglucose reductase, E3